MRDSVSLAVGSSIRRLRQEHRLSQQALGEAIGITGASAATTIGRIEMGEHDLGIDRLIAIAQALGVSPRNLLPD